MNSMVHVAAELDRLRDENAELVIRVMELESEVRGLREELEGFRWGQGREAN